MGKSFHGRNIAHENQNSFHLQGGQDVKNILSEIYPNVNSNVLCIVNHIFYI